MMNLDFKFQPMVGAERPPFEFAFFGFPSPVRRRVAETGQEILTNMFEHVAA